MDYVKICNALCLFLFIPYNNICLFWRSVMDTNDHCIISAINILMEKNSLCFNVLVRKQCRGAVNKEAILFSQLLEVKYILHVERRTVIPKQYNSFWRKKINVDIASATKTRSTEINFNITSVILYFLWATCYSWWQTCRSIRRDATQLSTC